MTQTKLNPLQTNDNILSSSIFRQALINGNCQVNQSLVAVNLTTGKLFGPVDMFYAKGSGTAVSAGTITQSTSANVGNSGYALLLSGVTLTGTGKTHAYTFIESLNAKQYKNKTASFSVRVYHDVGSAINYVIKINKADSADVFSAVTNISTGSAVSVANTTETLIKLENVSLGDCSNGIEIEIEASAGEITTKNFQYTNWQFNEGAVVLPFSNQGFALEKEKSQRFLLTFGKGNVSIGSYDPAHGWFNIPFPKEMFKTPAITSVNIANSYQNDTNALGANYWRIFYPETGSNITWSTAPTYLLFDVISVTLAKGYWEGTTPSVTLTIGKPYIVFFGTNSYFIINAYPTIA